MTAEEAKKMYENKYFYKIVNDTGTPTFIGPLDTIRFAFDRNTEAQTGFVEVIDGRVVKFFTKEEILVTDQIL